MTPSKSSQWGLFCSRLFSQCQLLLSKWVLHTINSKWVLVLKQWPASKHESNLSPSPRVVPQRFQSFSGPRLTPQRLCRPCCCNANGLHGRTQTSGHVSTTAVGWRVWLSPLSGKVSTTLPGSGNQFLFSSIGSFVNTIRNWAPWWAEWRWEQVVLITFHPDSFRTAAECICWKFRFVLEISRNLRKNVKFERAKIPDERAKIPDERAKIKRSIFFMTIWLVLNASGSNSLHLEMECGRL